MIASTKATGTTGIECMVEEKCDLGDFVKKRHDGWGP
jgi:hypothetical protein